MAQEAINPTLVDKLQARKIALASALTERWPWFSRRYADSDSPGFHRVRWVVTEASVIPERWVSFPGDHYAGNRPPTYREAGIMAVNRTLYDAALVVERENGGVPAVAFAVGGVAVAAEIPPDVIIPVANEEYRIAGRIGRGPLTMAFAISYPDATQLTVPDIGPRVADRMNIDLLSPGELLI